MRGPWQCLRHLPLVLAAASQGQQHEYESTPANNGSAQTASITTSAPYVTSTTSVSTCQNRAVNYITHSLPQQCLRADRIAVNGSHTVCQNGTQATHLSTSVEPDFTTVSTAKGTTDPATPIPADQPNTPDPQQAIGTTPTTHQTSQATESSDTAIVSTTIDEDPDSPFDSVNFLSFEEWKQQNLAKVVRPSEQVGQGGQRQRPGINNALDAFGEEGEIEIDFAGFGGPGDKPAPADPTVTADNTSPEQNSPISRSTRSKDAGKTCKERTNYASFDCAATVMKTNPQCKSASSILVENKDSYMLNPCATENKFFIVELCNVILVDTVVLANFEFFSSIVRHFRVSVAERYPVKMDKWVELGTYEARNTREIQAFLVENPLIWARYLRIEFLSHYGSEYYCPLSLLRVHGTTMLEEFRRQEELARGEIDDDMLSIVHDDPVDVPTPEESVVAGSDSSARIEKASSGIEDSGSQVGQLLENSDPNVARENPEVNERVRAMPSSDPENEATMEASTQNKGLQEVIATTWTWGNEPVAQSGSTGPGQDATDAVQATPDSTSMPPETHDRGKATKSPTEIAETSTGPSVSLSSTVSETPTGSAIIIVPTSHSTTPANGSTSSVLKDVGKALNSSISEKSKNATADATASRNSTTRSVTTTTSSPPSQPSTQESFYQSIHKRLQQLESNSTLSLLYIEEQSRILRDAFSKVEKRQLTTTTNFLSQLNSTVTTELHGFRQAYDQLWQSTVLELDNQREQYQREILALSSRLTLVADELVWQKRLGIAQSTLLLLCLGLALFARNGINSSDMPLYQLMGNKSSATLVRAGWDSPPASPTSESKSPSRSLRRRFWRSRDSGIVSPSILATRGDPESESSLDDDAVASI